MLALYERIAKHLPVQVFPSPSKPFLQLHIGPMSVSVHMAFMEQSPLFTSHEVDSANSNKDKIPQQSSASSSGVTTGWLLRLMALVRGSHGPRAKKCYFESQGPQTEKVTGLADGYVSASGGLATVCCRGPVTV